MLPNARDTRQPASLRLVISCRPDADMPHSVSLPYHEEHESFAFVAESTGTGPAIVRKKRRVLRI